MSTYNSTIYYGMISLTFTMRRKMGIFAMRRKSISQSLWRVVLYIFFVQEKLAPRRKSMMCSD